MGLAIVAIPEEQDRVWKISSEKIPHLTLLFLGETENADLQQIVQFVEHAVTLSEHGQFYLDVDRRGTLGDAEADVLFFSKRSWNLKWIKQFRGQLLQNGAVRSAYDSAEQFTAPQDWVPHLTLGYPETPAKPQEEGNDYPLYSVAFDRIAVWEGNFEGPEFRLEWPDRPEEFEGPMAVGWADVQKAALTHYAKQENMSEAEYLKHYGTKGMRWGQRKTETVTVPSVRGGHKTKQVTPKKAAKLDKVWEKNIYSLPGALGVHNEMASHFNARIGTLNDKHGGDFSKTNWGKPETWTPQEKKYDDAINALVTEGNRHAVATIHGTSPTGKRRAELSEDGDRIVVREIKDKQAKHAADTSDIVAVLAITRNAKGLITEAQPLETEDTLEQTVALGEEFLEHVGVKGMKWGVRRHREGQLRRRAAQNRKKADRAEKAIFGGPKLKGRAAKRLRKRADRDEAKADRIDRNIQTTSQMRKAATKKTAGGAKKFGKGAVRIAKDMHFESDMSKDSAKRIVSHRASKNWAEKDVPRLNAQYAGTKAGSMKGRLKSPLAKETIEYRGKSRAAFRDRLNEAVAELPGNASGTRRYEIEDGGHTNANYVWNLKAVDVKRKSGLDHAATDVDASELTDFIATPVFDDDGLIIGIKVDDIPGEEMTQSDIGEVFVDGLVHGASTAEELGEQFILEHYGIKGMRWGFRRSTPEAVAPSATSRVPHGAKRKTKVETEGGENHPATQDALRVAQAHAKLKKSGPKALTNQELREIADRVRLEEQVKLLTSNKAKSFVTRELSNEGRQVARGAAKKGAKKAGKKAATALLM